MHYDINYKAHSCLNVSFLVLFLLGSCKPSESLPQGNATNTETETANMGASGQNGQVIGTCLSIIIADKQPYRCVEYHQSLREKMSASDESLKNTCLSFDKYSTPPVGIASVRTTMSIWTSGPKPCSRENLFGECNRVNILDFYYNTTGAVNSSVKAEREISSTMTCKKNWKQY